MGKPKKLYRDRYAISGYDSDDDLVFTVDTIGEFANQFNTSIDSAKKILQALFKKQTAKVRYRGSLLTISFIDMMSE